jgi:hypothetical protein
VVDAEGDEDAGFVVVGFDEVEGRGNSIEHTHGSTVQLIVDREAGGPKQGLDDTPVEAV